jgi:hypothetical protein
MTLTKMHWLLGPKSKLSISNKILIYKTILKPVWTYGIQLPGTASTSNTEIPKRLKSKVLRTTVDAPWYVPNMDIRRALQTPTVEEALNMVHNLTSMIMFHGDWTKHSSFPVTNTYPHMFLINCSLLLENHTYKISS